MRKQIALLIAVFMVFTGFNGTFKTAQAQSYSVDKSIEYAKSHWNDGAGLCAEFVANCVIAGGLNIDVIKRVDDLWPAICHASGIEIKALKLDSNGYATEDLNSDILDKGDVVVQWCYTHNTCPHVILCNGYNSKGNPLYFAHNSAMDGYCTYDLSVNLAYEHDKDCNMGAKVIHLSSPNVKLQDTEEKGGIRANWANYDKKPNSVSNDNAFLSKTVSLTGAEIDYVRTIGFNLYYGDTGLILTSKVESPLPAGDRINMWYDIKNELGYTLEENTKYTYEFEITLKNGDVLKCNKETFITGPHKGYEVRLDANGGKCSLETITVARGAAYGTLPTPTKGGETFLGWYTSEGTPVNSLTIAEKEITLYAKWDGEDIEEPDYTKEDDRITVYFDPGKGTCNIDSIDVYPGDKIPYLPVPVRRGYTFEGWYAGEEYNNYKVTERTVINTEGDLTLCAKWKKESADFDFNDVKKTDWFYEDVFSAYTMGIVRGKTAYEYKPDENMTYGEAIKLAACMHQLYHEGEVTLENGNDIWYSTYVDYAKKNGIPWNCNDYNAGVTRRSYVHIFYYALPEECYEEINFVKTIADVATDDKFAEEIYAFYKAGILTGTDAKGSFNPASNIKRSEVAAIINRMMNPDARKSIMD